MDLIELVFPAAADAETRARARALCAALGKTAVEVPDTPGFVVNRLLFPFLFDAVALLEETGLEPQAIDDCMRMGAGHPMGPLALLDYVGPRRRGLDRPLDRRRGARADRATDRRGRARQEGRARASTLYLRLAAKCLGQIEVTLGACLSRRTYPSSQPLLQKHRWRPAHTPSRAPSVFNGPVARRPSG